MDYIYSASDMTMNSLGTDTSINSLEENIKLSQKGGGWFADMLNIKKNIDDKLLNTLAGRVVPRVNFSLSASGQTCSIADYSIFILFLLYLFILMYT